MANEKSSFKLNSCFVVILIILGIMFSVMFVGALMFVKATFLSNISDSYSASNYGGGQGNQFGEMVKENIPITESEKEKLRGAWVGESGSVSSVVFKEDEIEVNYPSYTHQTPRDIYTNWYVEDGELHFLKQGVSTYINYSCNGDSLIMYFGNETCVFRRSGG